MISLSFSISVNLFWKHLEDNFYEKNDLYGNKDLLMAQKAFFAAGKAIKELNQLPMHYRQFYTKMIIQKFQENIDNKKT